MKYQSCFVMILFTKETVASNEFYYYFLHMTFPPLIMANECQNQIAYPIYTPVCIVRFTMFHSKQFNFSIIMLNIWLFLCLLAMFTVLKK